MVVTGRQSGIVELLSGEFDAVGGGVLLDPGHTLGIAAAPFLGLA